jgi:hypothetical protein
MKVKHSHGQLALHIGLLMLTLHYPRVTVDVGATYSDGSAKPNSVGLWLPTAAGWRGKTWSWDWAAFAEVAGVGVGIAWNHVDSRTAQSESGESRG